MYAKTAFEFDRRPTTVQIRLKDPSHGFGCHAIKISRSSLLIMTDQVGHLPDAFLVALHPDAEPRPCAVAWRRGSMARLLMLD
ncbi:hypothetical protein [Methylobacterium symbioticum]|uniref:hypothetical protein n=1 Tax=Methylobacterium symbioticum TaxID=2584084 RepID=UPI00115B25B3|nr:hypothetical protein [Methylobacterium symbioticum]